MDISSLLLIFTVALAAVAFVLRPFLFSQKTNKSNLRSAEQVEQEHLRSSLLAEKERILSAIQELEFDHSLNKIPDDLYPVQRSEMMAKAAGILKQLDGLNGENQLAGNNSKPGKRQSAGDYDEVEALIAKHRTEGRQQTKEFCPHCGKPIKNEDKFCPKCGKSLSAHSLK